MIAPDPNQPLFQFTNAVDVCLVFMHVRW